MLRKVLFCCAVVMICAGCVGGKTTKVEDGVGSKQMAWEEFQENRPENGFEKISDEGTTKIFQSIDDMYGLSTGMLDKTVERTEHCYVALKLERIRKEHGEEAFKKALDTLSPEDEKEYDKYLDNEIDSLKTANHLLKDANLLVVGLSKVDVGKLAFNFLEYKKMYNGFSHASEQVTYSVKALSWMNDYRAALDRARTYQGR